MSDNRVTRSVCTLLKIDTPVGAYTEEIGLALADFMNRRHSLSLSVCFRFGDNLELTVNADSRLCGDAQDSIFKQEAESFLAGYRAGHCAVEPKWCPKCSQIIDMVGPSGNHTLGHEIACGLATGEGGCTCDRRDWPVCDESQGGCGQNRPFTPDELYRRAKWIVESARRRQG